MIIGSISRGYNALLTGRGFLRSRAANCWVIPLVVQILLQQINQFWDLFQMQLVV